MMKKQNQQKCNKAVVWYVVTYNITLTTNSFILDKLIYKQVR